jgi:pimeloyl-ACP methyl ester carboxylesterase
MTTSAPDAAKPLRSGLLHVNDIDVYHEVYGQGQPLIALHGGVGASEMFGPLLPALAERRQVVAVHLQGHGHTPDNDRPLLFETLGDDVAAVIRQLGLGPADLLGYSIGGGTALQTAIRHPEVVRRLVVVSTPAKRSGWYPEVRRDFDQMGPQAARGMSESPLAKLYPKVDFPRLFGKIGDLQRREYDWTDDVARISVPVMLAFADADAIRPEHVVEFFKLLGGGLRDAGPEGSARTPSRLAILPGQTHYDILTASALPELLAAFLDAPVANVR